MGTNNWDTDQLAQIVIECLSEGKPVEIDGLGIFEPDAKKGFRFRPSNLPRVFLAYVVEDAPLADRLFGALAESGFNPWMDRRKLVPGQNWPRAIENAIENADFFIACFSGNSVSKKGDFQAEIRYALDCARRMPLDEIFIIPVRLDACFVPKSIQRELQYVDLFLDWPRGLRRIISMMKRQLERRRG